MNPYEVQMLTEFKSYSALMLTSLVWFLGKEFGRATFTARVCAPIQVLNAIFAFCLLFPVKAKILFKFLKFRENRY